jgi:serine/threonine protein kinase
MQLDRQHYIGATLPGGFKLQRFIGKGAFAWVYYALTPDGRPSAVKIQYNLNDDSRKRFMREIKVLRELPPSPHCVRYMGDGHTPEGYPFLAMEFVNGQNLKQILKKRPIWAERDACELMVQLCEAFAGLHGLGLAHRDVKPENIMVTQDGAVKLMDFGLVKDAQGLLKLLEAEDILSGRVFAENIDSGVLAGTPEYMAPEQFSDPSVEDESLVQTDTWTDVYSLGLIFFELLTGRRIFPFQSSAQNQTEHAQALPAYLAQRTSFDDSKLQRPAAASDALWTIIERTLRQRPKERFRNAVELGEHIRAYIDTGEGLLVEDDEKTSAMKIDQFLARYGQEVLKRQMESDDDDGGNTVPINRDQLKDITAHLDKAQAAKAQAAKAQAAKAQGARRPPQPPADEEARTRRWSREEMAIVAAPRAPIPAAPTGRSPSNPQWLPIALIGAAVFVALLLTLLLL